jgi:hypothetical protein
MSHEDFDVTPMWPGRVTSRWLTGQADRGWPEGASGFGVGCWEGPGGVISNGDRQRIKALKIPGPREPHLKPPYVTSRAPRPLGNEEVGGQLAVRALSVVTVR